MESNNLRNVDNKNLAKDILSKSGLNSRASFYSGRGVNCGDLNDKNLFLIFQELLKLDSNYAVEFVEVVMQMKTLGATEFINSFMNFAMNGFKFDSTIFEEDNLSLDGIYGQSKYSVSFISIYSTINRGHDMHYQISVSEEIKYLFISRISCILQKLNPEFNYDCFKPRNHYLIKKC